MRCDDLRDSLGGPGLSKTARSSLKASLMAEGKTLASLWMKHRRNASQAAKRAKKVKEAEKASSSRPSAHTRSSSRFISHIDLSGSPSASPQGSSMVVALGDIAKAIRENTAEVRRVSVTVDALFSFFQNRVQFSLGFFALWRGGLTCPE